MMFVKKSRIERLELKIEALEKRVEFLEKDNGTYGLPWYGMSWIRQITKPISTNNAIEMIKGYLGIEFEVVEEHVKIKKTGKKSVV